MIPKFREWDAEREKLFKGKGMSYGVRKDFDNSFVIEFEHMEDLDAINKDGSIDRVVMMSTGLKDINGTEIYEGDILKTSIKNLVVEWVPKGACWGIGCHYLFHYYETSEVIGNKYQHPELLEGE